MAAGFFFYSLFLPELKGQDLDERKRREGVSSESGDRRSWLPGRRGWKRTQHPDGNETSHSAVAGNSRENAGRESGLPHSVGGRQPPRHGRRARQRFPIRRRG